MTLELSEWIALAHGAIGLVGRVATIVLRVAHPRARYARAIRAFELSSIAIASHTLYFVAKVNAIKASVASFALRNARAISASEIVGRTHRLSATGLVAQVQAIVEAVAHIRASHASVIAAFEVVGRLASLYFGLIRVGYACGHVVVQFHAIRASTMARQFVTRIKRGHCETKVTAIAVLSRARMVLNRRLNVLGEHFDLIQIVYVRVDKRGHRRVELGHFVDVVQSRVNEVQIELEHIQAHGRGHA